MNLLTLNQAKMLKSLNLGYLSAILNLQPAHKVTVGGVTYNTCPNAGACKGLCLQHTGRNFFDEALRARIRRTRQYYTNKAEFYALLIADIEAVVRKAQREDLVPTIRLNGLSDICFEDDIAFAGGSIFERFPDVQFIDYTKVPERLFRPQAPNYHLTYSFNEKTPPGMVSRIYSETRFNVARVYSPDCPTSQIIDGHEFEVISGDESDLRHIDPRGALIGLRFKIPKNVGVSAVKGGKLKSSPFLTILQDSRE